MAHPSPQLDSRPTGHLVLEAQLTTFPPSPRPKDCLEAHSGPSRGHRPLSCWLQPSAHPSAQLAGCPRPSHARVNATSSSTAPVAVWSAMTSLRFPHTRGPSRNRTRSQQRWHTADPPGRLKDTGSQGPTQPPRATHILRRGPSSRHGTRKPKETAINGHSGLCPPSCPPRGLRDQRPQLTRPRWTLASAPVS